MLLIRFFFSLEAISSGRKWIVCTSEGYRKSRMFGAIYLFSGYKGREVFILLAQRTRTLRNSLRWRNQTLSGGDWDIWGTWRITLGRMYWWCNAIFAPVVVSSILSCCGVFVYPFLLRVWCGSARVVCFGRLAVVLVAFPPRSRIFCWYRPFRGFAFSDISLYNPLVANETRTGTKKK